MSVFGFIGVGNMGGALLGAVAKVIDGKNIMIADTNSAKTAEFNHLYGAKVTDSEDICKNADYIFLGLKPQVLPDVLKTLAPTLTGRKRGVTLISMAAGVAISTLKSIVGDIPIIRIMPNMPALVGEGTILYAKSDDVTDENCKIFLTAMQKSGILLPLEERLIDAGSAISGCGPAFVDIFADALADGGVYCGLPRATAQQLAYQTIKGSAVLMQESGKNPAVLKDEVCSPAGTTIEGVKQLEDAGFRSAVMNAVISAYKKNFNLK